MRVATIALSAILVLLPSVDLQAGDWPRYRGPNSDGISTEPAFAELDSVGLEVQWQRKIGSGYSGISVASGRVVTMFSDGSSDVIAAFDEGDGTELWHHAIEPTYNGHDGSHDGPITTPLIHDGRVFGIGARGRLLALDLATGKVLWSTDLVEEYEATKPHYGFATSPLVQDGVLVVQVGGGDAAVVGLDPATGERKWSSGSDVVNYQSPTRFTFDGRSQVLASGLTKLFGLDAASGEILWTYDHGGEGYRGARSITPVPAGDGRIFLAYKDESSCMVQISREGKTIIATQLWEQRSIHNSYTVPVYYEGHLYGYSSRLLTCVDAATGQTVWRSRRPGDGFVALVDGHLVIVAKQGGLYVARATSRGYEEVAALRLFDDLAWTAPSFANGHIFVRSLDALARVGVRHGSAKVDSIAEGAAPPAGSRFERLLAEVETATDRKTVVDRFMDSIESFPLVEAGGHVHFIYRGVGEDLAIAGDMIGHRQERPMTRVPGTDLFYYSTTLEPDARVNYLFIRDYEELTDPLNPRKTTTMIVGREMEPQMDESSTMEISWLGMPSWKPASYVGGESTPRGRIESHRLTSEHLGAEHEIEVYLPAGYDDGDRHYPVAIVHGGAAALDRGKLTEALDAPGRNGIDPVILVFVNAFAPLGGQEPYAAMIAEELIPFIDSTYRTIASRDGRAHVGAGFSGFAALYCAFKRPADAAKVGTHSATMLDFMRFQLEPLFPPAAEQPFDIYMDWGKYDLRNPDEAWDMVELNRHLVAVLRERGYAPAGGETHEGPGWAIWQNRIDDLLAALFPANSSRTAPLETTGE